MKWTLIYFDDQIQNLECFKEVLDEDFEVIGTSDVTEYEALLQNHHPHAFIIDVHMPRIDGHSLYKKISEHPLYNGCPVFFISGDQSDENKIKSYEGGGVDFLSRDLKIEEIIVRLKNKIKFFLQRSTNLELGNLEVDLYTMIAKIGGKPLDLTLLELKMLNHILRAFPSHLSRQELIFKVWGNDSIKPGTINTHLTNLKPKIENWDYVIKVREDNLILVKKEKV